LADGSMKNVASYDKRCKLQNTPNTWSSNAHGGSASLTNPCLCEGCKEKDKHIVWRGGERMQVRIEVATSKQIA